MDRIPDRDEAAAIVAALERFIGETSLRAAEESEKIGPWQRAALAEGVGAKASILEDPQGGLRWLS
jgi:hypothetical protein